MKTREQLFEFMKEQDVAFIASVDADGFPNMKAMLAPRKIEDFYHKGRVHYEGVMLIGTMEVLQDEDIKKEIWHIGDKMYYRKGVTDPDYSVLKFTAIKRSHYLDLKTERFELSAL